MTLAALVLALIATPPAGGASEPLLLDFHASWCGPCQSMRPALESLAKAGYPIKSVDIDESPSLAKRYRVEGVPCYVVVDRSGQEMARMSGARPAGDIAAMYRKVQAKLIASANERKSSESTDEFDERPHRRKTIPVANKSDDDADSNDEADTDASLEKPGLDLVDRPAAPKPWETVVRIKMHISPREIGFGSGTVIYSTAKESIILTCAHIFKLSGRATPPPAQFPAKIDVDLFDGRLTDAKPRAVHFLETVEGEAIDYDFTNDVGLIRIRPGRRLPASPVVPVTWRPEQGLKMITVGCSEGHDATAWSTRILRPNAGLQHVRNGQAIPFTVMECEHAPRQGRSGGGLYTEDGYVAGVCDFADMQSNKGLYATPKSIYRLLDRNRLTALYRPAAKEDEGLIADNDNALRRGNTRARGQSPSDQPGAKISIPDPVLLGIPEPSVASNDQEDQPARPVSSGSKGRRSWQTRGGAAMVSERSNPDQGSKPVTAEMVGDPSPSDLDPKPKATRNPNDDSTGGDILQPPGHSKWRGIKRAADF